MDAPRVTIDVAFLEPKNTGAAKLQAGHHHRGSVRGRQERLVPGTRQLPD